MKAHKANSTRESNQAARFESSKPAALAEPFRPSVPTLEPQRREGLAQKPASREDGRLPRRDTVRQQPRSPAEPID